MAMMQPETFESRMASLLPGTIMFCGHRKTGLSILMRRLVEHLIDRPQTSDEAEELYVQIYTNSPDPLWTTIMDGRTGDSRIRLEVGGLDCNLYEMLPALSTRLNSQTRPDSHMIVVLDNVMVDYASNFAWSYLMQYAYDYNISFLAHTYTAPSLNRKMSACVHLGPLQTDPEETFCKNRVEDLCLAAVVAWDASGIARENIWKVFGTSFGTREEFEKHYQKLTTTQGQESAGTSAMIIEYRGTSNFAYNCTIPKILMPKK